MKNKRKLIIPTIIILIVALLVISAEIIIDFQWFKEIGYLQLFFTKILSISKLIIPIFIVTFIIIKIYSKSIGNSICKIINSTNQKNINKITNLISLGVALITSIIFSINNWYKVVSFLGSVEFNQVDPIFKKDISFYIFRLPFIQEVYNYTFILMLALVIITFIIYFTLRAKKMVFYKMKKLTDIRGVKDFAGRQLAVVSAIFMILLSIRYILKGYYLVYSNRGIAYGASYTDVNITLKFFKVITFIAILAAIVIFVSIMKSKMKPIIISIIAITILVFIEPLTAIVVQQFIVKSNEMEFEKKYIEYNIEATKKAFNIDNIEQNDFEPKNEITSDKLKDNKDIINNLKVNANKPVLNFYKQVQLIKNYYQFNDIDTDRYMINNEYSQVFISPREINTDNMTTWQNKHLRYTHGYGVAMSKVNSVTTEGQPSFIMKDIPTINSTNINIDNPRIYFGEGSNDYIIVNTDVDEFDYPTGESENTFKCTGDSGITTNFFNRGLLAIYEKNAKILFSGSINNDSKVILNKNIKERVKKIAPFLEYDRDPYLVIDEGKLVWIMDAYTVSDKYPFSEPAAYNEANINYIRNSVKVVIDAYNGDTNFYIVDKNDPMVMSYSKIFKGLFKDIEEMPQELKKHFRYPQDIFSVQTNVLKKYHTNDPIKLFTQEDLWDISSEIDKNDSDEIDKESLYLMTRLPGEKNLEMMLMEYFNMSGKQSMVALLGARMDEKHYGEMVLYKFPPQRTIYSPYLFKNRILQDPNISKEISLWEGKGSQVVYGDIIIVPIENSLLYLDTIYLKATTENSMPEMKRVILSNGDKIVIEENIEKALEKLFDYKDENKTEKGEQNTDNQINIKKASELYNKAIEAQKNGDWATYGSYINELGKLLEELNK